MPRRALLFGLAFFFTLGNLLPAVSDSYSVLLFARLITSLNHGAFFGVGSIVAANLVPPQKQAGAVAAMFMGRTLVNVVGMPLATWAGERLGWRVSFWGIAVLGVVTMAAHRLTLPALPAQVGGDTMAELRVLGRRAVFGALALTVVGSSAMFTVFTYITPILCEVTHASLGFVPAMLVTYGLGPTLGNWLGGKFADRSVDRTLIVTLASLTAVLIAYAALMPYAVESAVLIFPWRCRKFRAGSAAADVPNFASAMNIGAFNLGNALGEAIGGG